MTRKITVSLLIAVVLVMMGALHGTAGPHMRASVNSRSTPLVHSASLVAACYAPGTPPDVIAALDQAMLNAPGLRYNIEGRWPGSMGTPIGLSWSLVPDGLSIPSGGVPLPGGGFDPASNSELFSRMDLLFASSGGRAVWIAKIEQTFDRWSQLTGVGFYRVTSGANDWDDGAAWGSPGQAGARGDIRVSMKVIDGASRVLAYNQYPQFGGDMVIDRDENWASPENDFVWLRNTVMHEIGHGLGLRHVCPDNATKLMEPFIVDFFDGPQHDDLRGMQRLYGDRTEENDSVNEVINLGVLSPGTPIEPGSVPAPNISNGSRLSIDADGDQDYFRFSIASSAVVSVTVTPIGLTYDSSPQVSNPNPPPDLICTSGNFVDSLTAANLNVQLIGSDGSSVIATAASQPAGSVESIQNASLPAAGNYYVRVYEGDSPSQTQLYTLSLSSGSPCTTPSPPAGVIASEPPDGVYYCDRVLVTWQQVPGATSYQVWRNTSNNPAGAQQVGISNTIAYEDFSVTPGATYWYWVKACNACGCSAFSAGDSGQASLPPDPPTGVFASTNFCDRIEVYWNPVPNATGYRVYRNTVNNAATAQLLGTVPVSPFRDYSVVPGTTYYYWVRTLATCGASGPSNPAASGHAGGIAAPTGLAVADGVSCGCLTFRFNAVPGADHYKLYRSLTGDPATAVWIYNPPPNVDFCIDGIRGAWVYYWVQACDPTEQCCSPWSVGDRGYSGSPPIPENVTAADGAYCDRVRVTWDNIPSSLGINYQVLRDSQVIASGLTSSSYDDFTALPGTNYSYAVRAGNSCNPISEATWSPADTGYRTLVVTAQPTDAIVCLGRNHQFCTSAVGPDLGFQWQFNGTDISGAIAPCYVATLPGDYRCVISSSCGSVTTDSATLTVIDFNVADVNGDGSADGRDVQDFTTLLLSSQSGPPDEPRCAADLDRNGVVDMGDMFLFVEAILVD